MNAFLSFVSIAGGFLSWLIGLFRKDPVKAAYKEADKAKATEAEARERVIELEQKARADDQRGRDFDDFFSDKEY